MEKRLDLDIDKYQAKFYSNAIRSKRDVVLLWMETIKNFLVLSPAEGPAVAARLTIQVASMSRLFCTLEGGRKIFSVGFPFTIILEHDQYKFLSREGIIIDNRTSSNVISLINSGDIFAAQDFSRFIDPILEMSEFDPLLWTLVRELMIAEDGYIRYDWDEARAQGHIHPLHHLDIYYSGSSTFKLGLSGQIDQMAFIQILDAASDCHYVNPADQPPK